MEFITLEVVAGAVADAGFPADLVSAADLPGVGLAVATRATRPDRPSPCHVSNQNHTGTSRRLAIRDCTNSNAGPSS